MFQSLNWNWIQYFFVQYENIELNNPRYIIGLSDLLLKK